MIRVLVVDDQELVRRGIVALLGFEADIAVVGEAPDGDACLQWLEESDADVVLMDIRMPRRNGVEAVREIRLRGGRIPVILLTTFDEPMTLAMGRAAGAQACLLKDVAQAELVATIRAVAEGRTVEPLRGQAGATAFTRRELAVIRELCAGRQNKEIAQALQLSPGTVRNYLSIILEKLEVRDRTQAILKLRQMGLA